MGRLGHHHQRHGRSFKCTFLGPNSAPREKTAREFDQQCGSEESFGSFGPLLKPEKPAEAQEGREQRCHCCDLKGKVSCTVQKSRGQVKNIQGSDPEGVIQVQGAERQQRSCAVGRNRGNAREQEGGLTQPEGWRVAGPEMMLRAD